MAAVIERRKLREELRRVIAQLNAMPASAESWQQALVVEKTLGPFNILWPSEFRAAETAVRDAKQRSAAPALRAMVDGLVSATTLQGAHRINAALGAMRSGTAGDGIATLVPFVSEDVRRDQIGRLETRLAALTDAEVKRDREALVRLGDGSQGLDASGRWLFEVTVKYGSLAATPSFRALLDELATRRRAMFRGAESELTQHVQAARTTSEINAILGTQLSVPSDAADPVGGTLLQLARQRYGQLQKTEAVAAAQQAETRRLAASACASLDDKRGEGPTEREMCYAFERALSGVDRGIAEMKSACNEVDRTNPVAAFTCLIGSLGQVGGGPQYSMRAFKKIDCSSAASAGRSGFFCLYAYQIGTGNSMMAPLVNRLPGEINEARFVQSGGAWLFLPTR
jgi:hypothetical protein